ncbi:MAG: PAS domain-containing protein, partial [Pseudomonadota bacterium]
MTQAATIPIHVLSPQQDDAEAVNQLLRGAGLAVHCQWHSGTDSLYQHITNEDLLIIIRADAAFGDPGDIATTIAGRELDIPVAVLATQFDEPAVASLLEQGIRDVVTLDCPARLQNTLYREIRTTQMSRQIADNRDSALNVQRQFSTLLNNVPDAIAHVQEGIIVETNKAWLELFGRKTDEDVIATPFMDVFAKPSQPAVKGALVAISKDKWNNESLDVEIVRADGRSVAQSVQLQGAVFDD